MAARLQVRALIWVGERIVVHRVTRRGRLYVTLPGGRVNDRESVTDALRREVLEEIGLNVEIGDLVFAAEVVSGARRQDVELVFEARPCQTFEPAELILVDPGNPMCEVLPPVLDEVVRCADSTRAGAKWLGNIYSPNIAVE